jgi:hypothetical protein
MKKIVEFKGKMMLLPPDKDVCQICAVKHDPTLPHNAQSLYYQTKFQMENGRAATWEDAMAHCTEEVKKVWREALADVMKEKGCNEFGVKVKK